MDISVLMGFVQVIPVGVCLCLGFVIKYIVDNSYVNRFIPLINAIVGVLIVFWMNGYMSPDLLLTGLISGLSATGLYEAFRQLITDGNVNSSDEGVTSD